MEIKLITDSGALTVKKLIERPTLSFIKSLDTRTLITYPDDVADIAAETYLPGGVRLRAPYEIEAVLCYLLGIRRGLPQKALTVRIHETIHELPIGRGEDGKILIPLTPPLRHTAGDIVLEGGMPLRCYTLRDKSTVRITEADSETDYPMSLLRRLAVADGLPSAESVIAYRRVGDTYRYATTSSTVSYDSAVYLAKHLCALGVVGEITLIARGRSYAFCISENEILLVADISSAEQKNSKC